MSAWQETYRLMWWAYRFCWSDRASKWGLISSLTTVGGLSAKYCCFALASMACIGWLDNDRGLRKWCCSCDRRSGMLIRDGRHGIAFVICVLTVGKIFTTAFLTTVYNTKVQETRA